MSLEQPVKVTPLTFDRTINLPFLVTVFLALVTAVVWTSGVNHRLDRLEERTRGLPDIEVQLARIDERGAASKAALARIEQKIAEMERDR